MDILNILFRTIFFYFIVVVAYRIMGKREISQLQVIDLIVSLLMAELIAISIENMDDPIYLALGPICVLVLIEVLSSNLLKFTNSILALLIFFPFLPLFIIGRINISIPPLGLTIIPQKAYKTNKKSQKIEFINDKTCYVCTGG